MDRAVPELDARIRAALQSFEGIRVAYFFGSRARGEERRDSDLDVGVVFAPGLDAEARERVRRDVVLSLAEALGAVGERADVVDLHEADSAVAFRAIQAGRLLFARSEPERVRVETRVGRRYDDDAPRRALFRRAAREAVARMKTRPVA